MITIIDYGMGNIGSIENMIKKVGGESKIISTPDDLLCATKIVLPGVGAFDNGMTKLKEKGFIEILNKRVLEDKIPILGICLAMQLFTKSSEEGKLQGLGWIDAETVKFKLNDKKLKVPHMGWNIVDIKREGKIYKDMYEEAAYYFVHSYYVKCNNIDDILTTTKYGTEFVSSFNHENIYATQFHPEKSHKYGIKLIKNFVELV